MPTSLVIGFPDIPAATTAITSTTTFDSIHRHDNTRAGERYMMGALSSATTDLVRVNYDLGPSTTKSTNFVAMARADRLKAASCGKIIVRGSSQSAFSPSSISGLKAWFDATRGVTVDASQGVSQWNDLSGNGNHATQATAASRPILSRSDNQENLLRYSEQIDNAAWVKGLSAVSATNTIAAPDGTTTAEKVVDSIDAGVTHRIYQVVANMPRTTYRGSIYCKAAEITRVRLAITSQNETTRQTADFNISTGALVAGTGTISDAGSGWYRLQVTGTTTSPDRGVALFLYLMSGANTFYTGTGTDGLYVWGGQLSFSSADSAYIATAAYPILRALNNNRTLWFDGSADHLSADGVAAVASGDDKPHSIFFVMNQFRPESGTSQTIMSFNSSSSTTPFHQYYNNTSQIAYYRCGDSGAAKTAAMGAANSADSAVTIYSAIFNGTQLTFYKNGTALVTNADLNVVAATFNKFTIGARIHTSTGDYYAGGINEILVYNSALSDTDRQAVEAYLTTKWITTAPHADAAFSSATLYGPRADDYVADLTTSSAYRHWWVDFEPTASSTLPHSKLFFGSWFDMGREPHDYKIERIPSAEATYSSSAGVRNFARTDQPIYRLTVEWRGVSDDTVRDLFNNVIKIKNRFPNVFLYTRSEHQILDNQRLLYCELSSIDTESGDGIPDFNTVRATFTEVLG